MRRPEWLRIHLARKISLLLGAAVLLTIAATLVFPWLQMAALQEQAMLLQAKRIASAARQTVDLPGSNWQDAQRALENRWPLVAGQLGLAAAVPRLVPAESVVGTGFRREAVHQLRSNPRQPYYWTTQDNGRWFRFAMAVRGNPDDPYPSTLHGVIDVAMPMAWEGTIWNAVVTILAGASGAVLAILVFYLVTQRLVLSPVQALREVAERVTSGDLVVQSSIRSGDEFEELSGALNKMLAHLRAAQEEQQKINRSLDVRLGELAETNLALYESNRLKGEFLANVTHELRTPLISIIGFAELLRDAWVTPSADRNRLARYTQHILASARNLLDIINDLLDLAKIEAGQIELHLSEFSIVDLGRDLVDFVQPLADKRGQHLALAQADGLPGFRSDAGKIKQILYNLLSNAIKFTPDGGSIALSLDRIGDGRVRLAVSDTGPGIPVNQRDAIFEKFHQLDASATREHEGTGLGLAITKELVQILGGVIRVDSIEGQGSTFIVELPCRVEGKTARRPATSVAFPNDRRGR